MLKSKAVNILLVIIVVLATAAPLFYWFEWRPSDIRRSCREIALQAGLPSQLMRAVANVRNEPNPKPNEAEQNNAYRSCLTEKGLKPESLFVNLD